MPPIGSRAGSRNEHDAEDFDTFGHFPAAMGGHGSSALFATFVGAGAATRSTHQPARRASSEFVVLRQNAADLMSWVQYHRFSRQQTVDAFIQQCDAVDAAKHGV